MIRTALLAVAALLLCSSASAQTVHALDGTHETLSNNYQGRVLFIIYVNRSDRTQYATAIRLNDYYALSAAHVVAAIKPGSTPIVGTGTNALTDLGTTRNIIDWNDHPTWGGSFDGTAVDLGWLKFDSALPGPTETIKAIGTGAHLTIVGFGRPATPALGLQPVDRERRAFETFVDQQGHVGFGVSNDYSWSIFYPLATRNLPMAGNVTAGNSGSPGYGTDGSLRTMSVVESGSPDYNSSTFSLRLSKYRTWIEDNTTPPCLPDLNGDGIVDNGDIGVFVTLFLAGDLAADFNGDGILDNGDIGAFIAAFLAGC